MKHISFEYNSIMSCSTSCFSAVSPVRRPLFVESRAFCADEKFNELLPMVPEQVAEPTDYLLHLCLVAGVASFLIILLIFLLRSFLRLRRQMRCYRHQLADQLRFIRKLLDLCYVYSESPLVFLDKFKDCVNFRQLKSYDMLDVSDKRLLGLKEDERLLCALFDKGFTPRELCVIFGLKKINNLYVKYHRLRKKIERE